jgi:hypothetical protein
MRIRVLGQNVPVSLGVSLLFDLAILIQTAEVVLLGKGAR